MRRRQVAKTLAVVAAALCVVPNCAYVVSDSPLIGIVSEPCLSGVCGAPTDSPDTSYIAASYVKFIEMAGARAVALVYNDDRAELLKRLKSVNLLLFPGGAASLDTSSPFFESAKWMFEEALKLNTRGDRFPIHGTVEIQTFGNRIL